MDPAAVHLRKSLGKAPSCFDNVCELCVSSEGRYHRRSEWKDKPRWGRTLTPCGRNIGVQNWQDADNVFAFFQASHFMLKSLESLLIG